MTSQVDIEEIPEICPPGVWRQWVLLTNNKVKCDLTETWLRPELSICCRSCPCSDRRSPGRLPPAPGCGTAPRVRGPARDRTPSSPPGLCQRSPGWRHRRPGSPRTPGSAPAGAGTRHNLSELFPELSSIQRKSIIILADWIHWLPQTYSVRCPTFKAFDGFWDWNGDRH